MSGVTAFGYTPETIQGYIRELIKIRPEANNFGELIGFDDPVDERIFDAGFVHDGLDCEDIIPVNLLFSNNWTHPTAFTLDGGNGRAKAVCYHRAPHTFDMPSVGLCDSVDRLITYYREKVEHFDALPKRIEEEITSIYSVISNLETSEHVTQFVRYNISDITAALNNIQPMIKEAVSGVDSYFDDINLNVLIADDIVNSIPAVTSCVIDDDQILVDIDSTKLSGRVIGGYMCSNLCDHRIYDCFDDAESCCGEAIDLSDGDDIGVMVLIIDLRVGRISIPLKTDIDKVMNVTCSNNHHPNIDSSGNVCLGSQSVLVKKMVSSGKYKNAVALILATIGNANFESAYHNPSDYQIELECI